ncbi:hypothetical protein V6N13_085476 [Hibiscus sabdariffa]
MPDKTSRTPSVFAMVNVLRLFKTSPWFLIKHSMIESDSTTAVSWVICNHGIVGGVCGLMACRIALREAHGMAASLAKLSV